MLHIYIIPSTHRLPISGDSAQCLEVKPQPTMLQFPLQKRGNNTEWVSSGMMTKKAEREISLYWILKNLDYKNTSLSMETNQTSFRVFFISKCPMGNGKPEASPGIPEETFSRWNRTNLSMLFSLSTPKIVDSPVQMTKVCNISFQTDTDAETWD